MDHATIVEKFRGFMEAAFDFPLPRESVQYQEMRRAFFAGFTSGLSATLKAMEDEEGKGKVKRWLTEIDGFAKSVGKGA